MFHPRRLCVLGAVVCCLLQARAADKYTDENRPYEFGFNIEGEQHRHEKKDENGIIEGEFGFITADGVYHVTAYATDENGNFKIRFMKNIRVRPYPGTEREGKTIPTTPKQPSQAVAVSQKPVSLEPPGKSCSHCSLPTKAPPPAAAPQAPADVTYTNPQQPQQNYPQGSPNYPQDNSQNYPSQPQSNQNYPGSPQSNSNYPGQPQSNQNYPSQPQSNQNYPGQPQSNQNYPGQPQSNQNYPGQPQSNSNYPGQAQSNPNYPGQPQSNQNYPSQPQSNQNYPSQPQSNQNYPGKAQPNANYPNQPQSNSNYPSQAQDYPQGGSGAQYPEQGLQQGERSPKQFDIPPQYLDGPPPEKPVLIGAQMQIVDKDTDIYKLGPGERPGLPQGVTKNEINTLLYTFNYTVGFHGHHEEGYTNGAKKGYYYVTGRNGVRTRVDYEADENGFRPKITEEVLDLLSEDVPKEETEKDPKYGLKGYEFKWLYYPTNSR